MQLASSREIVVIHLVRWNSSVEGGMLAENGDAGFSALKTLLGLSQIKKVGVTILGQSISCIPRPSASNRQLTFFSDCKEDAQKVWRDYKLVMRGCVELNSMTKNVDLGAFQSVAQHPIGLAKLGEMFVMRYLKKDTRVRASNWEQILTNEQMQCTSFPSDAPRMTFSNTDPQTL